LAVLELRNTTIYMVDGFTGTALVDDTSIAGANTTIEIDTLAGLPNARTTVPIGARFTIATVANTTFTVTDANNNEQQQVSIGTHTGGTYTLTYSGQTTAAINFNAAASAVHSALEALSNLAVGDVTVTGTGPWVVEFTGTLEGDDVALMTIDGTNLTGGAGETVTLLHAGGTTWELTFTPALDGADLPADDDAITFLPIQIEITIGEGNLTYTETREMTYVLDRGSLDTVRQGNDVPLQLSIDFVYENVKTGTGEEVTPVDALKGTGGAADWTTSSSDTCEPYSIDIKIVHDPPCGNVESETTVFPDFRYETLEFDLSAGTIAVTGQCNATEPTITRA
jgi:hypothetical protein